MVERGGGYEELQAGEKSSLSPFSLLILCKDRNCGEHSKCEGRPQVKTSNVKIERPSP